MFHHVGSQSRRDLRELTSMVKGRERKNAVCPLSFAYAQLGFLTDSERVPPTVGWVFP